MKVLRGVFILAVAIYCVSLVTAIDVNNCIVNLSSANSQYVLTGNINSSVTCITVLANNVSFDLNGYNITANSGLTTNNFGISIVGYNDTKVYNGSIIDYSQGIRALRSSDNLFYNLTIASNKLANDHSLYGINLEIGSSRNNITNININYLINTDTTGSVAGDYDCSQPYNSYGICVYSAYNNTIKDVVVTNLTTRTNAYGFLNEESNNTYVANYTVNLTKTYGFYIDSSSFVSLHNTSVFTNRSSNTNMILSFSSHNIVDNLYSLGSAAGLSFSSSSHNLAKHISILNASNNAIFVSSSLNTTLNNVSVYNTNVSFFDLSVGVSSNSTHIIDGYYNNYSLGGVGSILIINKTGLGQIRFLQPVNGTGINFTSDLSIGLNNVSVRSGSNIGLNRSANITLVNMSGNFVIPQIYRNTMKCSDCYNFTSLNASTVIFNVTSFSDYSIDSNDSTNPVVNLISPTDDLTVSSNLQIFNATFEEDTALVNVTFHLWNETNVLINQTTIDLRGIENTTSLNVTLPNQGTFYWNYLAYDSSHNSAFNNSNYTLIYTISSSSGSSSSGGGGGGGGTLSNNSWTLTYNRSSHDLQSNSLDITLRLKNRVKFVLAEKEHHLGLIFINSSVVQIEVASTPQKIYLSEAQTHRFDLDDNEYYDLSVSLISIQVDRAIFRLSSINEPINEDIEKESIIEKPEVKETTSENFLNYYIGIAALIFILILVAILVILYKRRKKFEKFNS